MMAQLIRYRDSGDSTLYNRVKSDLYRYTTRLYRDQGWLELRSQQVALSMVNRVLALPDMGTPEADVLQANLAAGTEFRSAVDDKVAKLEATYWTVWAVEKGAIVATFATGAGALHVAFEGVGKKVLVRIATKSVVGTGITAGAVEGGGWVALEAGADPETVELLKRGAYSGIQLTNVLRGVRLDHLFSRSLPRPTVSDAYLQNVVKENWRSNAAVASGSTADAVRFERATGILLSKSGHTQKAQDTLRPGAPLRLDHSEG
jgi:hypothetical protein